MARKPETKFRAKVQRDLKTLPGSDYLGLQQVSKRGDPDLVLSIRIYFVWLELKAENGAETPLQTHKRVAFQKKTGCLAFVARPSNWAGIFAQLKKLAEGDEYGAAGSEAV